MAVSAAIRALIDSCSGTASAAITLVPTSKNEGPPPGQIRDTRSPTHPRGGKVRRRGGRERESSARTAFGGPPRHAGRSSRSFLEVRPGMRCENQDLQFDRVSLSPSHPLTFSPCVSEVHGRQVNASSAAPGGWNPASPPAASRRVWHLESGIRYPDGWGIEHQASSIEHSGTGLEIGRVERCGDALC